MKTSAIPWVQTTPNETKCRSGIPELITLTAGEIRRLEGRRGAIGIECRQGRVWVTQEGNFRDLILNSGEYEKINGRGLVLIESLESAVVRIFLSDDPESTAFVS